MQPHPPSWVFYEIFQRDVGNSSSKRCRWKERALLRAGSPRPRGTGERRVAMGFRATVELSAACFSDRRRTDSPAADCDERDERDSESSPCHSVPSVPSVPGDVSRGLSWSPTLLPGTSVEADTEKSNIQGLGRLSGIPWTQEAGTHGEGATPPRRRGAAVGPFPPR